MISVLNGQVHSLFPLKMPYRAIVRPHMGLLVFIMVLGSVFAAGAQNSYVIPIHGDIEPSTVVFVRSQATEALRAGAEILIFDIDTFGGRVDSALRISSFIGSIKDARTVAYVRSGPDGMGVSWSAGALIAMSCSSLYMSPGTSIGAAAPVIAGSEGSMESAGEKTVSAVRAQMAALAEKNGYPSSIALGMVDADIELYEMQEDGISRLMTSEEADVAVKTRPDTVVKIKTVSAKGKLLSLTAGDAMRYGLSSGTIGDLDELVTALGGEGPPVELRRTLADSIVILISSAAVQSILILLGLVAIFIEINTPGFGLPGTVALVAFLTLFGTNALMGTVGSLEIILFIVGLVLLSVEIFLLPGFGVAGISGIVIIAASLVLSMQDFVLPTLDWEWALLGRNVLTVTAGLLSAIVAIGVLALAGPRIKLFDAITLKSAITATASSPLAPASDHSKEESHPMIGLCGSALTTLRPSGRANIAGRSYSVETEGVFIETGESLKVVAVQGNRIIVAKENSAC
jgi:membrane-bound serine protease (ClpP class)